MLEEQVAPRFEVIKSASVTPVEHNSSAIRTSVEGDAERLISLLACSVPYLGNNRLALYYYLPVGELSSNSWLEVLEEPGRGVPVDKGCFTDT